MRKKRWSTPFVTRFARDTFPKEEGLKGRERRMRPILSFLSPFLISPPPWGGWSSGARPGGVDHRLPAGQHGPGLPSSPALTLRRGSTHLPWSVDLCGITEKRWATPFPRLRRGPSPEGTACKEGGRHERKGSPPFALALQALCGLTSPRAARAPRRQPA